MKSISDLVAENTRLKELAALAAHRLEDHQEWSDWNNEDLIVELRSAVNGNSN